ncbi:nitroreductase/quinone reductase family protein [Amycolatopsis jiangsuensis]|uniref:Deazaflavin-dependent oxidoreductase (Nitroreductase family) n=1 Tax=Amycolatopsis jiangsuensis TaxID=1181879 RepID=A0A840IRP9_9PSEU|nr:nitroreductase/quinone reductase family protein [Amycolatopsis jiangsuensis]MBB4683704.1 deazaflavin-dependent oxidoreductase (nitroreductase family) [Amycolatopsis jiangsuensis]
MTVPDYTSTVDIERPAGDRRTAEQWARAVWEEASSPMRLFLRTGWWCLGLRGRPAPGRVLGWTVAESAPHRIVLENPSRIMTSRNVVRLDEKRVRWTTDVDFDRAPARFLWSLAAPIHHRVIPARLRRAAKNPRRPGDRQHRLVTGFQRRLGNPLLARLPGQTLLETTGRTSGLPRRTPIGGRRTGGEFWLVSEFGVRSHYVRNIQADPRVRLRLRGRWHHGVAHPVPEDDARARLKSLPRMNSTVVRAFGTDLLTIRIDLD